MNVKTKGYTLACISAVTYGTIPLFALPIKHAGYSFDTALFYRFLFSAILIGDEKLFLCMPILMRVSGKELGTLAVLGVMYSLSAHFLFVGYDYMSAGVASTILFLYPVFVALIMGLFFREKLSWVMWGAIALALLGVGVLNGTGGEGGMNPAGMVAVLLSALAYALYMIIVNKSSVRKMEGTKVTFYSMLFCAAFFLLRALSRDSFTPAMTFGTGINILLFALVSTVISLITLVNAIKLIGSTPTAVMGSLEPVVAVVISVAVFNEPLTGRLVTGILLIIGAVTLTILSEHVAEAMKNIPFIRRR